MTASSPALLQLSTGTDFVTPSQGEINLNQELATPLSAFGPLLQQAVGALGEAPVVSPESLEFLPQPAQVLPHEGKLLPLLQQVLDTAAAQGIDSDTVLEGISDKLEALSADTDLDPGQAVATAIQQFIDENPGLAASIDTSLLRGLPGYAVGTSVGDRVTRGHNDVSQPLPATAAAQAGAAEAELAETATHPAQRNPTGQGRPVGEFIPVNLPRQEGNSLHEAAALFSRLVSEARSANTPEPLPRSDNLLNTLASMAPTAPAPAAAQPTSALPGVSLNVPFNQAGWDKALGERIQWMVGQGVQRASIKLNPAHLGPMEVRIQVQNEQASIQFTSAHSVVREALEAALPRLREMFDNAGVELADVDVSEHSFAEQQQAAADEQQGAEGSGGNALSGAEGDAEILLETGVYPLPETGRLDLFA